MPIKWMDIQALEGNVQWGAILPNGSSTGLLNYVLEYKTDVSSLAFYCAWATHPNIHCGVVWYHDGVVVTLRKAHNVCLFETSRLICTFELSTS